MREPFDLPAQVIHDPESGYSINVPVENQDYPGWWKHRPDVVANILRARKLLGIVIVDAISDQAT